MKHFYIIGSSDLCDSKDAFVKLGFSDSPSTRLTQLQPGNHIELVLLDACLLRDAKNFEEFVHRAFRENRVRGEWYKLSMKELRLLYDHMDNASMACACRACHGYYCAVQKWRKHPNWQVDEDGWYFMKDHEQVLQTP